jgi:hypothetical protein
MAISVLPASAAKMTLREPELAMTCSPCGFYMISWLMRRFVSEESKPNSRVCVLIVEPNPPVSGGTATGSV